MDVIVSEPCIKTSAPPAKASTLSARAALLAVVMLALVLRIWIFPARDEIRDPDEVGYVTSGLVMWEGMMPTERAVPAAVQTWISWLYIAARSGWDFIHLNDAPAPVRPFRAIDRALFKAYEDPGGLRLLLLWISIGISLIGVYGGYRLGRKYSGDAGGVLVGGLAATLPLFIEYAGISKSCSDAWMLGIAAAGFAATLHGTRRQWVSGILLGLAIASRIDMVMLAPLVLWMIWDDLNSDPFWNSALKFTAVSAFTAIVTAPWMLTGFVGMFRTIILSRAVGYGLAESPRLQALKDLVWTEGLGPVLLTAIVGLVIFPRGVRLKRWVLAGFTAVLIATMFGKTYVPIRYQGGPIIALLVFAGVSVGSLVDRIPRPAAAVISMLLLSLPVAHSVRTIRDWKAFYHPDPSTEWVEKNIPPGTIVYLRCTATVKALLPTEAAADANWRSVAGDEVWRIKMEDGFRRFSLPTGELPRAISDDNLVMDRGFCRRWFILGGGRSQRPRYELRVTGVSRTSGWRTDHLVEDFNKSGGVVVWRTAADSRPPEGLGEPTLKWVNEKGYGTLMYISPDVQEKMGVGARRQAVLSKAHGF